MDSTELVVRKLNMIGISPERTEQSVSLALSVGDDGTRHSRARSELERRRCLGTKVGRLSEDSLRIGESSAMLETRLPRWSSRKERNQSKEFYKLYK